MTTTIDSTLETVRAAHLAAMAEHEVDCVTRAVARDAAEQIGGSLGARLAAVADEMDQPVSVDAVLATVRRWDDESAMSAEIVADVRDAIDESIARDCVRRLPYTETAETELLAACDDSAETATEMEFWGTRDDGGKWRVHLPR